MIIDGRNQILGRLATFAAKQALLGERVDIVNCEHIVVSGPAKYQYDYYKTKANRGEPFHGPFYPKTPHLFVKRSIRGMLPYKIERGRKALKRVRCYPGCPETLKGKEVTLPKKISATKLQTIRQTTVGAITNFLRLRNQ